MSNNNGWGQKYKVYPVVFEWRQKQSWSTKVIQPNKIELDINYPGNNIAISAI